MLMVISCAFLNKKTEGIFLSNHSPRLVAMWSPVLNLKPKADIFEEKMLVKTIVGHIIKALLKSKIFIVWN